MSAISELELLLTAPAEALDVEYKSWLDLKGDDDCDVNHCQKANFGKSLPEGHRAKGIVGVSLTQRRTVLISMLLPL